MPDGIALGSGPWAVRWRVSSRPMVSSSCRPTWSNCSWRRVCGRDRPTPLPRRRVRACSHQRATTACASVNACCGSTPARTARRATPGHRRCAATTSGSRRRSRCSSGSSASASSSQRPCRRQTRCWRGRYRTARSVGPDGPSTPGRGVFVGRAQAALKVLVAWAGTGAGYHGLALVASQSVTAAWAASARARSPPRRRPAGAAMIR